MYKYMILMINLISFNLYGSPILYEKYKIHVSHRVAHSGCIEHSLESGELTQDDLSEMDKFGNTLLHYAAYYNSRANIISLLNLGADINSLNKFKETPLFHAIKKSNQSSMIYLICRGAHTHLKNVDGKSVYGVCNRSQSEIMKTVAVINSVEGDYV